MPFLDIATEVVLDPMIACTTFQVVRRQSRTDTNGIAQRTAVTISPVYGSVTPTGDNSVNREDAFESQSRTLLVTTRFLLRSAMEDSDGVQWEPDLIYFNDGYYLVKSVEGYGNFGSGFVAAICESFNYDIAGTMPNPPRYGADDYKSGVYTAILGALA